MAQRPTVQHILGMLEQIASFSLAESWDNVGLMVGDPARPVHSILVALDPTAPILLEALEHRANLVITHHPLIFHPLKTIRLDQPVGRFLQLAMDNDISVIGCHTNLDTAAGGVNDVLADCLGLQDVQPLAAATRSAAVDAEGAGFGRFGRFAQPMNQDAFLALLGRTLGLDAVAIAGILPPDITTVAVCGGSGSDLAAAAFTAGAEVFVTGEVKHSTARWAEAVGFCLIDAGHFATEHPVVAPLARMVGEGCRQQGWDVVVYSATSQHSPFAWRQINAAWS